MTFPFTPAFSVSSGSCECGLDGCKWIWDSSENTFYELTTCCGSPHRAVQFSLIQDHQLNALDLCRDNLFDCRRLGYVGANVVENNCTVINRGSVTYRVSERSIVHLSDNLTSAEHGLVTPIYVDSIASR